MRRLRHRVGEARRGAEKIGEEKPQAIVRLQDGEEFDGGRHAAESAVEGSERAIGIGGAAERREQRRRELGQHLARARALDRGTAAEMPAAHGLRHALGLVEAEALQGRERIGIVVRAGEDEAAHIGGKLRPLLEEQRVMPLHDLRLIGQGLREGFHGRDSRRTWRSASAAPRPTAGAASARRPPSAAGARWCAGSGRPRRVRRGPYR